MPDSLVVTQVEEFRAALLLREVAQMRAMAAEWLTVERALEDGINELIKDINLLRAGGRVFNRAPDPYLQLERYRTLLEQTRRELAKYATYAEGEIRQGIEDHARLGVEQSNAQIETVAQGDPAVLSNFNRMSVPAVENMAALLADGAPVGRLLREAFPEAAVRMTDALITGTALGWNPRKTSQAMTEGLQAGALQRALVIARTEQLRSLRTASLTSLRQSNVVRGYMRMAAKSGRTCLACLVADGTIYELESEFDEHPSGRCQIIPLLKGRPDPVFTRGRAWLEAQPAAVQKSIMGQGAWRAWKDGALELDDLVQRHEHPVWGGSLGVRALRDAVGAEAARGYSGSAFYSQDNARAAAPAVAAVVPEPEPPYTGIVPKSILKYVPQDIIKNLPTAGKLHDLAVESLDKMERINSERNAPFTDPGATGELAQIYDNCKRMPSKDLEKFFETHDIGRDRLKGELQRSDYAKYKDEGALLEVAAYAAKYDRRQAAVREIGFRKGWYKEMRRVSAIADGNQRGAIIIDEDDMRALLGRVGDVYRDAGKKDKSYEPGLFRTSDLTGAKIRYYVEFPSGEIGHPDEISESMQRKRVVVIGQISPPIRDWTEND